MPPLRATSRRAFLLSTLTGLTAASSSCGTLLYPERRGQPAGRLDWGVVLLDAIGLLLFFVPGVVAFAIDFATGCIYLPEDEYYYGAADPPSGSRPKLRKVSLNTQKPTVEELETVLRRETGVKVSLRQQPFLSQDLDSVDEFWTAHQQLHDRAVGSEIFPTGWSVSTPS